MAVVSGNRQDQVRQASVTRERKQRQNKIEKGATVAWKCTQNGRGRMSRFACSSARQGLGIYIDESESIVIHCMLCRERGKGERKVKVGSQTSHW